MIYGEQALTFVETSDTLWQAVEGVKIRAFPRGLSIRCKVAVFQLLANGSVVASYYRRWHTREAFLRAFETMQKREGFTAEAGESFAVLNSAQLDD